MTIKNIFNRYYCCMKGYNVKDQVNISFYVLTKMISENDSYPIKMPYNITIVITI